MDTSLRVMTWNIHACVGTDRRRDPGRIAAAIGDLRPDVLALQEVDLRDVHADPVPLLDLVAGEAGMHRYEAFTIEEPGRRYGNVLMSRWPIDQAAVVDLACRAREPRLAIDARVATPLGPLRVLSTHFGLSRLEREEQIGRLVRCFDAGGEEPAVLMGDFNDWRSPGSVGRRFGALFPTVIAPRSFPSRLPVFRLDRIFLSAGLSATPLPTARPFAASDHRSVAAEIRMQKTEYITLPS